MSSRIDLEDMDDTYIEVYPYPYNNECVLKTVWIMSNGRRKSTHLYLTQSEIRGLIIALNTFLQ